MPAHPGDVLGLCAWYEAQCRDEWHEDHGIEISTLDNPGWALKVDLRGTAISGKHFEPVKMDRTEMNWMVARRNADQFEAFGGPRNLGEMIATFLTWAN